MENNEQKEKKSGNNRIFIYLSIILTGVSAFLGYQLYTQKEVIKTQIVEIEKKGSEYDIAKQEISDLKGKYDSIQTDNKQLQSQLDQEREHIADIEEQLEKAKGDAAVVAKLRRELTTIRNLIKSYLKQIDSLNTQNQQLQAEKAAVVKDLDNEKSTTKQLNEEKQALSAKVELGAKLKTYSAFADGINEKGSSKEVSTSKARRTDKIRCCFTLAENSIAKEGERIVYMKITGPDGKVYANGSDDSNTFMANGQKQQYSAKKTVNYNGKSSEVCMIFKKTEDFKEGKYRIELFAEDAMIGATSLELK